MKYTVVLERSKRLADGECSPVAHDDAKRCRAFQKHDVGQMEPLHDGGECALGTKPRVRGPPSQLGVILKAPSAGVHHGRPWKVDGELSYDVAPSLESYVVRIVRKNNVDVFVKRGVHLSIQVSTLGHVQKIRLHCVHTYQVSHTFFCASRDLH